jgi:hypothetical protein
MRKSFVVVVRQTFSLLNSVLHQLPREMDRVVKLFKHPKLVVIHNFVDYCNVDTLGILFVWINLILSALSGAYNFVSALLGWKDFGKFD